MFCIQTTSIMISATRNFQRIRFHKFIQNKPIRRDNKHRIRLPLGQVRVLGCITKCSLHFPYSHSELFNEVRIGLCRSKTKINLRPYQLIPKLPYPSIRKWGVTTLSISSCTTLLISRFSIPAFSTRKLFSRLGFQRCLLRLLTNN